MDGRWLQRVHGTASRKRTNAYSEALSGREASEAGELSICREVPFVRFGTRRLRATWCTYTTATVERASKINGSMVSVRDVFAATFSELRPDGPQRGRRIFAAGDSSRQPPSIDVSL